MNKAKSKSNKSSFRSLYSYLLDLLFLVIKKACSKFAAKSNSFERFPDEAPH